MRPAVRALPFLLIAGPAAASEGLKDLYLQAAAVGEKCTAATLGAAEVGRLAQLAGMSGRDLSADMNKARAAATAVDCDTPHAEIHVQFFNRVIRPGVTQSSADKTSP